MLYVSTDTKEPEWVLGNTEIVIHDTEDSDFTLVCKLGELWDELRKRDIVPQTVVGLFKSGRNLLVTPVSGVELQVLKLLKTPYFFISDKLGQDGASAYSCYGLYNFTLANTMFGNTPDSACSVAKLLLETCGDVYDRDKGGQRIETTRDYIAVCVDNTKFQSTFLRFDIEDYGKVTRAYTKYKMLNMGKVTSQSMTITLPEE